MTVQAAQDTFIRIEDKFVLSREIAEKFESLTSHYLKPCYPIEGTEFTLIESIYFDSPELRFFVDHFSKAPVRFKMRLRRYAPNGVWSDHGPVFLEIKRKENGICEKVRFAITQSDMELLLRGGELEYSDAFQNINPGVKPKKLKERAQRVNTMMREYRLKPQVRVTYCRHAYEENGFRVTFDSQINTQFLSPMALGIALKIKDSAVWLSALEMGARYKPEEKVILEVKHSHNIPEWFTKLVERNQVSEMGFSKYCWGITQRLSSPAALGVITRKHVS